ncbi:glutaredoxin [Ceratobasidium sp. 423]|nr:glutaredoxin [Ceratobasidium sp. 423]
MIVRSFIILRRTLSVAARLPPASSARLRTIRFLFPLASPFATTSSGPTLQQKLDMSVDKIVDDAITNKGGKKHIAIFSKSHCPYCTKAKAQINEFVDSLSAAEKDQVELIIYELDNRNDGSAIQNYLEQKTKQRTVPNIFISEKHIGGSSDLASYTNDGIRKVLFPTA